MSLNTRRDRTGRVDSRAAAAAARPAQPSGSADNAWRHARLMSVSRRPPTSAARAAAVDRIVLEHHQGVEQLARSGQPLDLRQTEMLVRHQPRLAVLHLLQQLAAAACSAGSLIRSGSVLMNSPTMLSMPAISGGRPATVTPNTTSSRPVSRPSRMPQAAWIKVFSVRPCCARLPGQRRGQRLAQRQRDLLGRDRHSPGLAAAPARVPSSKPGQCLPPGRDCGGAVLRGDPGQIIAIRRHPRQRAAHRRVRIERQQLPHQHGHRPAIHQDVMVGEHQPMLFGSEPDQRKPQQRRRGEIEALGAVRRQDGGQPLLALRRIQQATDRCCARAPRPAAR